MERGSDRFLVEVDSGGKALELSKWEFLRMICTVFFETVVYWPVKNLKFKHLLPIKMRFTITFLLFMYQVILAAGNEVPTWHVALRLSFAKRVFFSTIIRGSSLGNSITCMTAVRISVWNKGASSDTSHWNCPVKSLVTPRSVTEVASECVSCEEFYLQIMWKLIVLYLSFSRNEKPRQIFYDIK